MSSVATILAAEALHTGKRQVYDWPSYYKLIRKLQPKADLAGILAQGAKIPAPGEGLERPFDQFQGNQSVTTFDPDRLTPGTTYYWRITFWDDDDTEGAVSATQNFTTGAIPNVTKTWGEDSSRDDYTGVTEDTYLDEHQPIYDMGTSDYIRVGDDGSRINRTLIKYDLSTE